MANEHRGPPQPWPSRRIATILRSLKSNISKSRTHPTNRPSSLALLDAAYARHWSMHRPGAVRPGHRPANTPNRARPLCPRLAPPDPAPLAQVSTHASHELARGREKGPAATNATRSLRGGAASGRGGKEGWWWPCLAARVSHPSCSLHTCELFFCPLSCKC